MCHVAVRHDQVIIADDGCPFAGSAAVDSDALAKGVIIADDDGRFFAMELKVLRDSADDGSREDMVPAAHTDTGADDGVCVDDTVRSDGDIVLDDRVRSYLDGRVHVSVGVNEIFHIVVSY